MSGVRDEGGEGAGKDEDNPGSDKINKEEFPIKTIEEGDESTAQEKVGSSEPNNSDPNQVKVPDLDADTRKMIDDLAAATKDISIDGFDDQNKLANAKRLYNDAMNSHYKLNQSSKSATTDKKKEIDEQAGKLLDQISDMQKALQKNKVPIKKPYDPNTYDPNDKKSGMEVDLDQNDASAFSMKDPLFLTEGEKTILGQMARAGINLLNLLDKLGYIDRWVRVPLAAVTSTVDGLRKQGWSSFIQKVLPNTYEKNKEYYDAMYARGLELHGSPGNGFLDKLGATFAPNLSWSQMPDSMKSHFHGGDENVRAMREAVLDAKRNNKPIEDLPWNKFLENAFRRDRDKGLPNAPQVTPKADAAAKGIGVQGHMSRNSPQQTVKPSTQQQNNKVVLSQVVPAQNTAKPVDVTARIDSLQISPQSAARLDAAFKNSTNVTPDNTATMPAKQTVVQPNVYAGWRHAIQSNIAAAAEKVTNAISTPIHAATMKGPSKPLI